LINDFLTAIGDVSGMTNATTLTSLFSAVDAIATYDGRGIPAGASASIAREVARLRSAGLPVAQLRGAEAISIEVHRMTLLLAYGGAAARDQAQCLRRKLLKDCWAWIASLPLGHASLGTIQ
jgi:hypothetical protein